MNNKTRLILISLLIVVTSAWLKFELRRSRPGKRQAAIAGSGGSASIERHPISLSNGSAMTTKSPIDSMLTAQLPVVSGGSGVGKSPSNSVEPLSTPGVPQEVLEAAQAGLPFFLGKIPPGSQELYGFASTDDLSAARLGAPLQMLMITPSAIDRSSSGTTVSSLVSETSMWFFPIRDESESKAMLVVDRDGGTWKAVSFGYAGLGHELNELSAQWPDSKGFHPELIAVFAAKQFYFTVPEVDDFNLTQIRLTPGGFSKPTVPAVAAAVQPQDYGTLSQVSKSLDALKPIVSRAELHVSR
jgi:hypothetical protein